MCTKNIHANQKLQIYVYGKRLSYYDKAIVVWLVLSNSSCLQKNVALKRFKSTKSSFLVTTSKVCFKSVNYYG